MDELRTIIPTEDSFYQWWQVEALWDSFKHVAQPGRFTALVASRGAASTIWPWLCPHETTEHYARQVNEFCPLYNKPGAVREWLAGASHGDETILMLDPDCVFLCPLTCRPELGRPVSQHIAYLSRDTARAHYLIGRYCRSRPDLVRPIGIPTFIRSPDLRLVVSRWFELTLAIRRDETHIDPAERAPGLWISDMWAFAIAIAEMGMDCVVRDDLAQSSIDYRSDRAIIHYCYPVVDSSDKTLWDKRGYAAWSKLPQPAMARGLAGARLLQELDRIAATRNYAVISRTRSRREGSRVRL